MKLICFLLCVAFTSYTVAYTKSDIDLAVIEILKQVDSNAVKLNQVLGNDLLESSMLGKIEATEGSITGKIEEIEAQVKVLNRLLNGTEEKACNCLDIKKQGRNTNGVYYIYATSKAIQVYCDMETDGGGWLVFQRRTDGFVDFHRNWNSYKRGFGNVTQEFWLGNENLYQILNQCGHEFEIRIDLVDFEGEKKYAKYSTFNIASQDDNYKLTVADYSGDAGDSLSVSNGDQFTTRDRDHEAKSNQDCPMTFDGAWWYDDDTCHRTDLNGQYLVSGPNSTHYDRVIEWYTWTRNAFSLKFAEMKIRPKQ